MVMPFSRLTESPTPLLLNRSEGTREREREREGERDFPRLQSFRLRYAKIKNIGRSYYRIQVLSGGTVQIVLYRDLHIQSQSSPALLGYNPDVRSARL